MADNDEQATPPEETDGEAAGPANAGKPVRSPTETRFLAVVSIGTFVISVLFVAATVFFGFGFPAPIVAILLGICIATLAYAFLGGVDGSSFELKSAPGVIKLGGAVAVIMITFWLAKDPIEKNMNDVEVIAKARADVTKYAGLESDRDAQKAARTTAENKVKELDAELKQKQAETVGVQLDRIRRSTANDPLGKGVLQIFRDGEGPFSRVVSREKLKAGFHNEVPDGTFWYCHDKKASWKGKKALFEHVVAGEPRSRKITLSAGADIGWGACQTVKVDVQLGCDAAQRLLGLQCDSQRGVGWPDPSAAREFEFPASVMNPEFGGD